MPSFQRPGATIAYTDTGGSGPVVVFSHGILMDQSMFDPQVLALKTAYRCITWDQRGHGATGPAPEAFSYWDSAADLIALLDTVGAEQAVLVGMSQGGFVSLRAALMEPDRVRALVLLDTQAGQEAEEAAPLYRSMAETWAADGYDESVARFVAGLILGADADVDPWLAKWQAQPKAQVLQPVYALVGRDDITNRLGDIAAPALVVHGVDDAAIPMERAQALADGLPGCAGVVTVPGGHAANLTHPARVTAAVTEFLARL